MIEINGKPFVISQEEHDLKMELDRYVAEKEGVTQRMLKLQAEIAEINAAIRGRRLSPPDYKRKCDRQVVIKQSLVRECAHVKSINGHMRKLNARISELHVAKVETAPVADQSASKLEAVAAKLVELRRYYLEFARDDTRVNSMRKLAAEFSSKLTEILKEST